MTRRELRENVFKMLFRVEFFDAGELSERYEQGRSVRHYQARSRWACAGN